MFAQLVCMHTASMYAQMCARECFALECFCLSVSVRLACLRVRARLMHKLTIITAAPCSPILSPVYFFSAFVSDVGEDKDNVLKDSRYLCPNPET